MLALSLLPLSPVFVSQSEASALEVVPPQGGLGFCPQFSLGTPSQAHPEVMLSPGKLTMQRREFKPKLGSGARMPVVPTQGSGGVVGWGCSVVGVGKRQWGCMPVVSAPRPPPWWGAG